MRRQDLTHEVLRLGQQFPLLTLKLKQCESDTSVTILPSDLYNLTNLIDGIEDPLRLDVVAGSDVLHINGFLRTIVNL